MQATPRRFVGRPRRDDRPAFIASDFKVGEPQSPEGRAKEAFMKRRPSELNEPEMNRAGDALIAIRTPHNQQTKIAVQSAYRTPACLLAR
jgi:hypothetical protein